MRSTNFLLLVCVTFAVTGASMIAPDDDSPPMECPPQICSKGYYLHPEICECFIACDYIMLCDAGFEWDFIECGCVPKKCDIVECPGFNVLNTTSCACECEWNEENCSGPRTSLDLFDCSCVRYPCDPPWPCPEGEMIDWEVCGCVPDPDYVSKPTKLKCKPVEAEEEVKPIKNIRPHHRQ